MTHSTKQIKTDIKFIFEVGTLKRVGRGWDALVRTELQNVAEHTFRTIWIAYILSHYSKEASTETTLKFALAYNLARTRISDPHYVALPNVVSNREKAIKDILRGTSLEEEFTQHISTYYEKKCIEAEIVYVANAIENILELKELETEGLEVAAVWLALNYKVFYPKITLKAGKELLDQMKTIKPYGWHLAIKDDFQFNKVKTPNSQQKNEINFFYEIGTMRYLPRNWTQFVSTSFSNVSEHTFRTIWIGIILCKHVKNVDVEKVILMLLIHDLDEIRGFDLNYKSKQYVEIDKERSVTGTVNGLKQKDYLLKLYAEYRLRKSPEAKLAKDADSLESIFELKEKTAEGVGVASNWIESNKKRLLGKLNYTYSNLLFETLITEDPNSWHLESKNRFSYKW